MNSRFPISLWILCGLLASVQAWGQGRPSTDGQHWHSEAFAEIATKKLQSLKAIISSKAADPQIFDASFSGQLADELIATTDVDSFQIRRFRSSGKKVNAKAFVGSFAKLPSAGTQNYAKFKLIRIKQRPSLIETIALVTIAANSKSGRIESNQRWRISWTTASNSEPKIVSINILQRTDSLLRQSTPLFVEKTHLVFRSESAFRKQLAHGQPHWLRRIEAVHGMHNQGQNGLSVGDVNGDGLDDLYVCQPGGLPNRLLIHQPDGTLKDVSHLSNTNVLDNSHASLIVDFDNDGDQDLIVSTASALLFFDNLGSASFRLVKTEDLVADAYSLAAADFDNDGDLDVYACGYFPQGADVSGLPVPVPYFDAKNGGRNHLIENRGRWRTVNSTNTFGLNQNNTRFSYACLWIDIDNDADQDLYVANDFGPDNLFLNQVDNGRRYFQEVSQQVGIKNGAFGMSVDAADVDHNGFEDLYVANMYSSAGNRVTRQPQFRPSASNVARQRFQRLADGNTLFRNDQGKKFTDIASSAGVSMGRWSWGANFVDINNDGWEDVIVTNGYITGDDPGDL